MRFEMDGRAEVLDQAELVALGICHHDHDAFVVVVPLTGKPAPQGGHEVDTLVYVVDGKAEMDPDLALLWFLDRLEHDARLGVASLA
jgi:hypothetical protein